MKSNFFLVSLVLFTAIISTGCDKSKKESADKSGTNPAEYSYAIGVQIGKNLKSTNMEIDAKKLAKGIEDSIKDKSSMNEQEIMTVLQNFEAQIRTKQQEKSKENVEIGKDFLEKNKSKSGVKTTESGLQYEVVQDGAGETPKETDTVSVHYKGTLINGEEFDSSYKREQPAQFQLNQVIKGWTEGLQLMKKGAKYKLYIPSDLAYGPMDRPGIPGNSVLIFEVELLDIVKTK